MAAMRDTDTIAAVATADGRGGIGIVRLSGPEALSIGEGLAGRSLEPRHAHHCRIRDPAGNILDDAIVIAFPGPRSFTGEDVVEIQGHGSPVVLQQILRAAVSQGVRLARPGEFSERAYLNDRIDLAQAEAIADLIAAGTEAAARGALRSLQGEFSRQIHDLMEAVTMLRVYVEAAMDFPDEDVDFLADGDVEIRLAELGDDLDAVRRAAGQGVLLGSGITLVLAGAPNAGKSSLMNALARRDTAIVTAIPGTTRDVLREPIDLDGLPVQLIDTAGLRDSSDPVEAEGVRRARAEVERADCLLFLVDAMATTGWPRTREEVELRVGAKLPARVVLVQSKIDLLTPAMEVPRNGELPAVAISALTGEGMEDLKQAIRRQVGFAGDEQSTFTARARHLHALDQAADGLAAALETLRATGAGDLVAEDLRLVHEHLGEIVGAVSSDALLGRIFSSFCIGK
ncbi:MAG: tRNA uridine-5-carboxymethylaminomethyl(34) synthesis GTPase MnmE [Gammaproteobacteria bacterium]|nr:tRNA uridine-5-carboxymethylaminomethyl(34) synthesis GTPase MnmE [Gammaproteobacteria bacterium]